MKTKRICVVPRVSGVGGMVSFQAKLTANLAERKIGVTSDLNDTPYDAILIIGGTRQLAALWRAKLRGVPIVQRLDGINWLHRKLPTGLRHYLRAEYGNRLLAFIRQRLATKIVYQSHFVVGWWERAFGPTPVPHTVIHNAVDLNTYTPHGNHERPQAHYRLLLVEGSLSGGYELGIQTAVRLAENLRDAHDLPIELMVVGRVARRIQAQWQARTNVPLRWAGLVPQEHIPQIDRSAHVLYSADINAACPNAVIEALACGLPVVAFDTGALPELVPAHSGQVVPYGGDPWQLDAANIMGLAEATAKVLQNQEHFRAGARAHAETNFSLDEMTNRYLEVLLGGP